MTNVKGVAQEDRELFNTFVNSGQRRNLADLITAKIEAHENRVHFAETESEPQRLALPPKVIEVYKKSVSNIYLLLTILGSGYFCHDTSLGSYLKHSKSFLPPKIGRRFLCSQAHKIGPHMQHMKLLAYLCQISTPIKLSGTPQVSHF